MAETKRIKTALVSVFHKDGLDALLKKLHDEGVKFLSTGGTQKFIEELGYPCQAVEEVTTYPSILGGRVKSLHPKISAAFSGVAGWLKIRYRCNNMKYLKSTWSSWTFIRSRIPWRAVHARRTLSKR